MSTITLSAAEDNNNYFKPISKERKASLEVKGPSLSSSRDNLDRASRKSSRKLSTQKSGRTNLGSSTDRLNGQRKISHSSTNLSLGSDFTKSVNFLKCEMFILHFYSSIKTVMIPSTEPMIKHCQLAPFSCYCCLLIHRSFLMRLDWL